MTAASSSTADAPGSMVRPQRPGLRRMTWIICFLAFAAISGAWSMSVPIFSAPDEHSHVIKAASVVRGEILGRNTVVDFAPYLVTYVDVPLIYDEADQVFLCYVHRTEVPADCARSYVGPEAEGPVATLAGKYPPYYYVAVGAPTLVSAGARGLYATRLLSALVSAGFFASAVLSVLSLRSRVVLLGLALGVTPTALYLAGMVNPNGLEVAAAASFWASGLALTRLWRTAEGSRLLTRWALAGAALGVVRGAGWIWLAIGVIVMAILVGATEGRAMLRRRGVVLALGTLALATLTALVWSRVSGSYDLIGTPTHDTLSERIRVATGKTGRSLREMIGDFGFADAPAPPLTQIAWQVVLGAVVLAGLAASRARAVLALVVLVGSVVTIPIILETAQASTVGYFWLGRYTLPLAMGVPLIASLQLASPAARGSRPSPWRPSSRLVTAAMCVLATAHAAAWYWAVRRYAVGLRGHVWFMLHRSAWSPPVPVALALVCLLTGLTILLLGSSTVGGAERRAAPRSR